LVRYLAPLLVRVPVLLSMLRSALAAKDSRSGSSSAADSGRI
jgi:hypothetical protein